MFFSDFFHVGFNMFSTKVFIRLGFSAKIRFPSQKEHQLLAPAERFNEDFSFLKQFCVFIRNHSNSVTLKKKNPVSESMGGRYCERNKHTQYGHRFQHNIRLSVVLCHEVQFF